MRGLSGSQEELTEKRNPGKSDRCDYGRLGRKHCPIVSGTLTETSHYEARRTNRNRSRSIHGIPDTPENGSPLQKEVRMEGEAKDTLLARHPRERSTGGRLFPVRVFEKRNPVRRDGRLFQVRILEASFGTLREIEYGVRLESRTFEPVSDTDHPDGLRSRILTGVYGVPEKTEDTARTQCPVLPTTQWEGGKVS